ncbi:Hypothetical predicted protein [Mytilus galloprovincialis]|uniref:ZMYM2-like/QRICH1 C-terminal domain-containing protein n=1 Tax=Mytilus galloprovincialis TaxID=29158 RepID=A0A8B6H5J1_MYTGA|nr:Hypothetical predicted protein [Mytilus galloprovincialis]
MESVTRNVRCQNLRQYWPKVYLKNEDEMTKNQRESDHQKVSGHMPEDPEMSEYCPVKIFETYLSKLHLGADRLWQYPKENFNSSDECWYTKFPIGKDTLSSFLSTLSNKVGCPQHTPITLLEQQAQLFSEEIVQWHR